MNGYGPLLFRTSLSACVIGADHLAHTAYYLSTLATMGDTSNDRTIGRTNLSSPSKSVRPETIVSSPSPLQDTNALSASTTQPLVYTTTVGSKGLSFEWPTNASHYQLMNRIGQGAFASVWRARIRRRTKINDDEAAETETAEIHCAIKIMDLEHVNININGESLCSVARFVVDTTYFVYAMTNSYKYPMQYYATHHMPLLQKSSPKTYGWKFKPCGSHLIQMY